VKTNQPNYPKRFALLFPILVITVFAQTPDANIQSLIDRKEYFKAKDSLVVYAEMLPVEKSLYFGAILDNVFNRPNISNEKIRHCLEFPLSDTLVAELLKTKLNNDIRMNDYKSATVVTDTLLNRYLAFLDSATRTDIGNDGKAWRALASNPPTTADISCETTLPMKKDIVGLLRIPVRFGKKSMKFVFDTGANLSVVSTKTARKLGVKVFPTEFDVQGATGNLVKSKIGVADEIRLGDIVVKNVVFIVMPDKELRFLGFYKVNGIIGFPVINQLKEIRLNYAENTLTIPAIPTNSEEKNFAMEGLMPLINVGYRNESLVFTFDTGAQSTSLYPKYYEKYAAEIDSTYELGSIISGSAGGMEKNRAYKLTNVQMRIAGRDVVLPEVSLLKDVQTEHSKYFFGNLGQDAIRQFKIVVINFDKMFVAFE